MHEYLDSVRDVEQRVRRVAARVGEHIELPAMPVGVPELYDDHVKLMYDLQVLAFQTDVTRVSTFMLAREASTRTYSHIGVPDPHHAISHHGNAPDKVAKHAKINTYHVDLFRYFLGPAARDAGRRRHAAGSFAAAVRRLHQQRQPAHAYPAAGAAGRRRG